MRSTRKLMLLTFAAVAFVATTTATPASARHPSPEPVVEELATFAAAGCGNPDPGLTTPCGSGSTVGPDGALYVTDPTAGVIKRVDPTSGQVTEFASGLPKAIPGVGIGGAMDVVFVGRTAYALVTLVDFAGTGSPPQNGIYRLEKNGTFTLKADIGEWSRENPPPGGALLPETAPPGGFVYALPTGVQYALETFRGQLLVTDGHHNRILRVTRNGEISNFVAFGEDNVPTGLEVSGRRVYVAQAGPVPHDPATAKVLSVRPGSNVIREVASGQVGGSAGLTVDVEFSRGMRLYGLLQGLWDLPNDPANAGAPASSNSGELVSVERDGTFSPVVGGLDRPTSLEFIGNDAFVVTLTGKVIRIDNVSPRHHGRR